MNTLCVTDQYIKVDFAINFGDKFWSLNTLCVIDDQYILRWVLPQKVGDKFCLLDTLHVIDQYIFLWWVLP